MRNFVHAFFAVLLTACQAPNPSQEIPREIPLNPALTCIQQIAVGTDFDAIKSKLALGTAAEESFEMLTNNDKPTEEEKTQIAKWIGRRLECDRESAAWLRQYAPPEIAAINSNAATSFFSLTADLYNGKLTYGEYAHARARVVSEAQAQDAVMMQRLRERPYQMPAVQPPTTTNCYVVGNQMNCTTC